MECNASLCIQVFEHDVDAHANDIEVEVNLSFRDAVKGCMKQVSFSAKNLCDSCGVHLSWNSFSYLYCTYYQASFKSSQVMFLINA
jgi:DnaJ-class molecular chaperone